MLSDLPGKRLNIYVPDYVVFDLETTGLSPKRDEVIEIAALKVRDGSVVDEFSTLVNPGRPIPRGASAVNGINDRMVASAPYFTSALYDFLRFAGDDVLVGHNIQSFDLKFLYRDAAKFWSRSIGNDYIDTLILSRQRLPGLPHHSLGYLAEYYGLSADGAHRALFDCHMNHRAFELMSH